MSAPPHILVVDDHAEIRQSVTRYLQKNGMRATGAGNTSEMDDHLGKETIDLIVLDIMMPGEDGLAACARLRREHRMTPILMLTALGEDDDRIKGLDTGADDYLAKPFNPRELLARIKAILRRNDRSVQSAGSLTGQRVRFADWVLDTDRRVAVRDDGQKAQLTSAEFKLLTVLLERPRFVLSRQQLLDLTSGRPAQAFDRVIDNQVSRLRRKIERDVTKPELITTVRGGGYSLVADVKEEA